MYKARLKASTHEISQPLKDMQTVVFLGKAEVESITKKPLNNGEFQYTYNLKPLLMDLKASEFDKEDVGVSKDFIVKQKSESQTTRQLAFRVSQDTGENSDDLYNQSQEVAREWLQDHLDEIKYG